MKWKGKESHIIRLEINIVILNTVVLVVVMDIVRVSVDTSLRSLSLDECEKRVGADTSWCVRDDVVSTSIFN